MQKCLKCNKSKSSSYFGKLSRNKSGLNTQCKQCISERYKKYNKDDIKTKKALYYIKNKEKIDVRNKEYYNNNLDNIKKVRCKYRKEHESDIREYHAMYRKTNKEKISNACAEYYAKNKKQINDRNNEYYHNNKEIINKRISIYAQEKKDTIKNRKASYYLKNKEIINKRNSDYYQSHKKEACVRVRNRKNTDIQFKLCILLRDRLCKAISSNSKSGSAVRDLGCSIQELKERLECKFAEGMSWSNHGLYGWHIDHIKPLASFDLTNREELLKACNYKNLQPLWAKDNLSKGSKTKDTK